MTATPARQVELDFAAYAYCTEHGISVRPGEMPPVEVYIAIGGQDHPMLVAAARKRESSKRNGHNLRSWRNRKRSGTARGYKRADERKR